KVSNNTIQYNQYYGIKVNATGNSYLTNFLNGTPSAFYCSTSASFPGSSFVSGNICTNSTGCGFLSCKGQNTPANLSQIKLGSTVTGCGSINSPGTYSVAGNIDMGTYSNVSNPATVYDNVRCIDIAASDVILNCGGHTMTHGSYAIYSSGQFNVTVENCRITNFNTGISFLNVSESLIKNVSVVNASQAGISLTNTTAVSVQNNTATSGNLGMFISNSASDVIGNPVMSKNQYGVYVSSSLGNIFQGGSALNNTNYDVYATSNSANESYNIMQGTTCGLTNAQWATCTIKKGALLAYYPITGCGAIVHSGNYSLTSNVVGAQPNCINVTSSNVALNCHGNTINGLGTTPGAILRINGRSNVTVSNCKFYGLKTSVNVTNSSDVFFSSITSSSNAYGLRFSNVTAGYLEYGLVTGANNATVYMNNVSYFSLNHMNLTYAGNVGVGIEMINSRHNTVEYNNGLSNYIGLQLSGNSGNNTVSNNTMSLDNGYDYICNGNSGVNAELGGINYGTTKSGCKWLAAIPLPVNPIGCALISEPDTVLLTTDAAYGFGSTCFSVLANDTTINCNGHTVIATHGGTLAYFQGSHNSKLLNCVLKGFSNPILATNSTSITLLNNTISIQNQTSGLAAITMLNTQSSQIQANNVTAPYLGINFVGGSSGSILNNIVGGARYAYEVNNATSVTVKNNTAFNSYTGISFINSNSDPVSLNNMASGVTTGMSCSASSQSNVDLGGNICSMQSGCSWIRSSSSTCPT
ncbi:MAG: right-handed parallel beta-helix repeat-containing protein, partial [Candidatus Micrarchaeota archaeon]|nr:right-handed parallel beta-helix repeat-containing protein [Candidatus Micrarchaeota archaeon]